MLWLLIVLAYLLGSLSGSLWVGKLYAVDIRTQGSGNAGGTNAFRTQGAKFALAVVIIDVGKGLLAAYLAQRMLPSMAYAPFVAVFAAVLGHIWPIFHGFRGGKGAATLVGGLILIWPQSLAILFAVWLLCLMLTGYVGLSTVLAAISLVLSAYVFNGSTIHWQFAIGAALLLTFSHRSNLQRLVQGTESRFEKARILGRLFFSRRG